MMIITKLKLVVNWHLQVLRNKTYGVFFILQLLYGCGLNSTPDVNKNHSDIDAQNEKAHRLVNSYPDSSISITLNTESAANLHSYTIGVAKSLSIRAIAYSVLSKHDSAIILHRRALGNRKKLNDNILLANSYSNIGETYQNIGDLQNAILYADSAYKIYLAEDSTQYLSGILGNLGICYIRDGDVVQAKRHFLKSIFWAEKVQTSPRAILSAYKNYGIFANRNVHPDTSVLYKQKAIQLAIDNRMDGELARLYLSLGRTYAKEDAIKANQLYDSAIGIATKLNLPLVQEKIIKAQLDANVWSNWRDEKLMYDSLVNTLERNYDDKRLNDFAEFEVKYKTAETKAANDILKVEAETKRKQQVLLFIVIVGLLLAIFFIARSLRLTKKLAQQENEMAKQQIDSLIHGQELQQIDHMLEVQEKERRRIATDLHDRIGSLLGALKLNFGSLENHHKSTFESTPEPYEAVKNLLGQTTQEVRRISHDMSSLVLSKFGLLQAIYDLMATLKSSGSLHIELHENGLESRLSAFQEITLYRILQELVSNTLKHANAKSIEIHLTKSQNQLMMMVIDDGIGFDENKKVGGMGLQNVKDRVRILDGTMSIDSHEKSGTSVTIEMQLSDE